MSSFFCVFFFFKQKTAYEIKESDWSSDVCSSDLNWSKNADLDSKYYDHGLKILFPVNFLAVSLHISDPFMLKNTGFEGPLKIKPKCIKFVDLEIYKGKIEKDQQA